MFLAEIRILNKWFFVSEEEIIFEYLFFDFHYLPMKILKIKFQIYFLSDPTPSLFLEPYSYGESIPSIASRKRLSFFHCSVNSHWGLNGTLFSEKMFRKTIALADVPR